MEKSNIEAVEFPIVCISCLGPNPYVRMQKFPVGGICHISGRPYTVFRWKGGSDARYKKTVICQEVAKVKNVCQVCLLDLDYNLPVQVRDHALNIQLSLPTSDTGKEFALNQMDASGELDAIATRYSEASSNHLLAKLARNEPYFKRNQARLCSFFIKGSCSRGAECPYRHEMPTSGELSKQNYHDRYYGINDPVAKKIMARAVNIPTLNPPKDSSITTLFVGNISSAIKEMDLREIFCKYGKIESIRMLYLQNCAFITFCERQAAEQAASNLNRKLFIKGLQLSLRWGKPRAKSMSDNKLYESMDPNQFGTVIYSRNNHAVNEPSMNQSFNIMAKKSLTEPEKHSNLCLNNYNQDSRSRNVT